MHGTQQSSFIRNAATLAVISLALSGCLMGEEETNADGSVLLNHELTGSVGDGPVIGATMRILRNDGVELAQAESDSSANYNITVRTEPQYYPLSIDAVNGTDIVTNAAPDFVLLGAVFQPGSASVANVNPFSTFAVELARDLSGGINMANLETAEGIVSSAFNNGLSSLAASGPMTTTIDSGNVAEIIRASEALGETVRRTRDALGANGFTTSGDIVVQALSSDLTDSVVDGSGGPGTDARIAAVAVIVSAQVLLETMANELHVNGADATALMSNAIDQVGVGTASPVLADLTVTAEMLERVRIGIVAAHAITSDTAIADLLTDVEGVQTGTGSSTIRTFVLPSDYRSRLNNAILLAAGGSTAVVTTVNDISRDGTQTIGGENQAPTISGTPASSAEVGSVYSFTPTVTDPDGGTPSFTVSGLPSWADFNDMDGTISGTPQSGDVNTYSGISITVSDGQAEDTLGPFTITVNEVVVNTPPVISGTPPADVNAGQPYSFTPTVTDPDGGTPSFTVSGLPSWANFNDTSGTISGTPQAVHVGTYTGISITVSDGQAEDTLGPFTITVSEVVANSSPTISGIPGTDATAGIRYVFIPTASDPNGDDLTFSVTGKPSWLNFNTLTGRLRGTPTAVDEGPHGPISITVSDGELSATLGPFSIEVIVINTPPVISGSPPADVNAGETYSFTPTVTDPDDSTFSFTVSGLPVWAIFNDATGEISGTPQAVHVGTYTGISITVSDGQAEDTLGPFTITVNEVVVNTPPVISGSPQADVNAGQPYSFTPTVTDPDGGTPSFTVSGLPSWANFSDTSGTISGTPQAVHVGTYTGISITVSDGQAEDTLGPFTITVQAISLGSVTLNWTAPTLNEDGTDLIDLDGYIIFWGTEPDVYPNSERIENESVTTYVVEGLAPGTYRFAAKSFNTAQVESRYSGVAVKVVP